MFVMSATERDATVAKLTLIGSCTVNTAGKVRRLGAG